MSLLLSNERVHVQPTSPTLRQSLSTVAKVCFHVTNSPRCTCFEKDVVGTVPCAQQYTHLQLYLVAIFEDCPGFVLDHTKDAAFCVLTRGLLLADCQCRQKVAWQLHHPQAMHDRCTRHTVLPTLFVSLVRGQEKLRVAIQSQGDEIPGTDEAKLRGTACVVSEGYRLAYRPVQSCKYLIRGLFPGQFGEGVWICHHDAMMEIP